MRAKLRQSGVTLTELAVVIGVMAVLLGVGLPAVRMVIDSFESGSSANSMISAALASARALAAKEGHYVGVRFQKAYNPDAADPLDPLTAPQYMIFIIHDPDPEPAGTGLANGFRALEGIKPIKLPESIGVMDLTSVEMTGPTTFTEQPIDTDIEIDAPEELRGTTTFSIVFSPSGKLLMHEVRVRNRNGRRASSLALSLDDVFNKKAQVDAGIGMFYQDDYFGPPGSPADFRLSQEYSRRSFIIYSRLEFKQAYKAGRAWSDYLARLVPEAIYINPYTGMIISKD